MRRRKRKLVRLDLQLKVVLVTLFVAGLSLLINFQLNMVGLWGLTDKSQGNPGASAALESVRMLFVNRFILAVIIAVPLAAAIGIVYSFKFAGPIYRFRRYFGDMVSGRWDQHVSLRKADDLQDISVAINAAMDQVRSRLKAQEAVLSDFDRLLAELAPVAGGAHRERVAQLRQRISAERSAFLARFPVALMSTSVQGSACFSVEELEDERAEDIVSA